MLMCFGCIYEGQFFSFFFYIDGQSNVEVELLTKNYVEKGSSVTLYCRHNFDLQSIYKVNKQHQDITKDFLFILTGFVVLFYDPKILS